MSTVSRTRERMESRRHDRRRRQQFFLLGGIVVVAVVAVVIVIIASLPRQETPVTPEQYTGIPRGRTVEGWPRLGETTAPVTIHEYGAFTCSHCADFHDVEFPQLLEDIRAGRMNFVFVPTVNNTYDVDLVAAAVCANDQDRFWEMHDVLFPAMRELISVSSLARRARLVAEAGNIGMDEDAFNACLESSDLQDRVQAIGLALNELAQQHPDIDITGTPTFTVNGVPTEWGSGYPETIVAYFRQRITDLTGEGAQP